MPINISPKDNFLKIQKLINSSRFNEAFLLLKSQLKNFPSLNKDLQKLLKAESTYRYMLDFLSEGHDDPSRDEVISQIKDTLSHSNDILYRELKLTDSSDLYSSTRRLEQLRKTNIYLYLDNYQKSLEAEPVSEDGNEILSISPAQASALDEIFNYVWTMTGVEDEEYEALLSALTNSDLPDYFKSLMVSALLLGNISYFDPHSYEILLNLYDNTNSNEVKARAIIGIILLSLLHADRISSNIDLRSRLLLSAGDTDLKKIVNDVLLRIVRTYDTKRIDDKMRNEVIPGLMKLKPEIMDQIRNMASDSENFLSDGNPNWEELLENSGVGNKLQEINEMQMEGADVMVTAFSNLKGFPFFNKVSNWFLPFVPGYYEFSDFPIAKDRETLERLTTVMCDSDLNSFLLSLKSMPEIQKKQMFENMQHQMKEAKEALSNAIGDTDSDILSKKINHSLQDLYRFFKFFKKKNDFTDPFATPFLAKHIEALIPLFGISAENIRVIGEFYFKNKYFEEAAGMFELVDSLEPGDFTLWEKIGYSYDRIKLFDKATDWYLRADIINPGSAWLEKKLAVALKNAGKGDSAIEYYVKSLAKDPENYHLIMSAGQCLLDNGNISDALKHFYHAQYLMPEKLSPMRAIAWAELLGGNFDKAGALYQKILENKGSDKTDSLNAAHNALASGNFKNALNLYKDFISKSENGDITSLVIAFRDDAETIKKIGIKTSDLRLIIDKIRYDNYSAWNFKVSCGLKISNLFQLRSQRLANP